MYVVSRPSGSWEVRESLGTPSGPRSRTLASFRVLNENVAARALARASGDVDASGLRIAARRAGAPIAEEPTVAAAASLLANLSSGGRLSKSWTALVIEALGDGGGEPTENERAASTWMAATPQRHGETLWDLLLLADRIPRHRDGALRFPPLARGKR